MGNHPPEVAGEVRKILYRNRCGMRLGAHNLFWALGADCALAGIRRGAPHVASGCGAANIAMRFVLAKSGCVTPFMPSCCASFREQCCGELGSHCLLFLEEDCYTMLERADSKGAGAGKSAVAREAMVVQQVWAWLFPTFEQPLLHYNTPPTAACTAASFLSTAPQARSTQAPSATQLSYSSPIHGGRRAEEPAGGESQSDPRPGGIPCVYFCSRSYCVHNSAFIKPKGCHK